MENRLMLNKKPEYELPDEVVVERYAKRPDKNICKTPDFEPDLCLNQVYNIKIDNIFSTVDQIWIKTDNINLIDFIKKYDFNKHLDAIGFKHLCTWRFKKIILEEFYNKRA